VPRCRNCLKNFRRDPEKLGARCPQCRLPFYEREQVPADPLTEDGICPAHPENVSVGTCQRCGNFVCVVCRTAWQKRTLCVECVTRALDDRTPTAVVGQITASALSIILGIVAWVIMAGAIILAAAAMLAQENLVLVALAGLMIMGSAVPSLLGLGQGASAIRARGGHLVLAMVGLILSGLHIGILIGLFSFSIWQNL